MHYNKLKPMARSTVVTPIINKMLEKAFALARLI